MTALLLASLLAAATAPPEPPRARSEWFGIPALFYTPETSVGGGGFLGYHFTFGEGLPVSSAHALAFATTNAQVALSLDGRLFLDDRFVLSTALSGAIYPDLYYGVGPRAPRAAEEELTSRRVAFTATPQWVVARGLRVGPRLHLHRESFGGFDRGGAFDLSGGARPFTAAGAGATATWDARDSQFQPRTGAFAEASWTWYPGALSTSAFSRGSLDVRGYFPWLGAHVLAAGARLESAWGDVPVMMLPRLGGGTWGRGYREGRWRDRVLLSVQVEDRFPIVSKLRGAVFAGAAEIAARVREADPALVRPYAGAGVRWRLSETGAAVRADVGLGTDGVAFYFVGMEPF